MLLGRRHHLVHFRDGVGYRLLADNVLTSPEGGHGVLRMQMARAGDHLEFGLVVVQERLQVRKGSAQRRKLRLLLSVGHDRSAEQPLGLLGIL